MTLKVIAWVFINPIDFLLGYRPGWYVFPNGLFYGKGVMSGRDTLVIKARR